MLSMLLQNPDVTSAPYFFGMMGAAFALVFASASTAQAFSLLRVPEQFLVLQFLVLGLGLTASAVSQTLGRRTARPSPGWGWPTWAGGQPLRTERPARALILAWYERSLSWAFG